MTGDVTLLIKEGKAAEDDLLAAWQNIGYEYAEVMEMGTGGELKSEYSCEYLQYKANLSGTCIEMLKIKKSEIALSVLRKLFPKFAFDYENKEAFNKDMIRAIGLSKNWVVEYMAISEALNAADQERLKKLAPNTLNYYYESLSIIKEKFHICPDLSKYTVLEYCVDSKMIIKQNIAATKAAAKNARNNK